MSNQNEILNSEEVEFLLDGPAAGPSKEGGSTAPQQVATMRGDLEQMPLADIFQTLGMSKMEGILRVCNPVEQRIVAFKDGIVRILVPPRAATRRLGQRLVQAGMLDPEQLRMALLEQRKQHKPLGELLIASGYVAAEQIDDIVATQVTEDLFSLFTWEHGEFEFWKGPPADPALAERLEACPEFEINSLLLEVARRSDEWESILEALRSLDEIALPVAEVESNDLDETHRSVLLAIDGRHTYRELGDITVMSLFDCARAARDLMRQGLIATADEPHVLQVAQGHLEQSNAKMALVLAQTLRDRGTTQSVATVREIAGILRRANESAMGCEVLLEAAQLQSSPQLAMELATEALAMNPRDLGAQSFLRTTMLGHLPADSPEVEQVTITLIDGLLLENDNDRALAIIEETRTIGGYTPMLMVREARALAKKKDKDGAIDRLLAAAAIYAERGELPRQIEALEIAFRIDRDRKDLGKMLRALRSTPRSRAIRIGIAGVSALLLISLGVVWFQGRLHADRALSANTEIAALLTQSDLAAANAALARWENTLGECPELDDLRNQVRFAVANDAQRKQKEAMKAAAARMQSAGDLVLAGDLTAAFRIYQELATDAAMQKTVDEAMNGRVEALLRDLVETNKHLPGLLPGPPGQLAERAQVEDALTLLRRLVPMHLRDAAHALLRQRDGAGLPMEIAAEKREALLAAAERAVELLDRGAELLRAYEAAAARDDQQRRLDPLFKQALDSEQKLDFAGALVAYRQLVAAKTGTPTLLAHFAEKVQMLEGIVGVTQAIAAATQQGDFATALREYRTLQRAHPKIPFDQVVRLPVTVRSSTPGATLRWNGADAGVTPKRLAYLPGVANEFEVALPRFLPLRAMLPFDHTGVCDLLLTLQTHRAIDLEARIDQPLAVDGRRAFAVDRAGNVLGLDLEAGRVLWRTPTGDTAGYLSPPLAYRDDLLIGSLDGPLRAVHRDSGTIAWTHPDVPTEYPPALLDGRIALVDTRRTLWLLDPKTGQELGRIELPAPVRSEPVAAGPLLCAALADGTTAVIDPRGPQIRWRSEPEQLGSLHTASAAGLIALRDDGSITCVDPATGSVRWQRTLGSSPIGRPDADAERVLVTLDDRAVVLAAADGKELWTVARPADGWHGAARFCADLVVAPARGDTVLVRGRDDAVPRYQLAAEGDLALCLATRNFTVLASGRRLLVYRQLP